MSLTAIIPVPPAAAVSIHKIFNGKSLYDHKILTLGAKPQLHTVVNINNNRSSCVLDSIFF